MLALTRGVGESIIITDPAGKVIGMITIVDVHGNDVRLGTDFPREYGVDRKELAVEKGLIPANFTRVTPSPNPNRPNSNAA